MTESALRAALERLDEAIDRMENAAAARTGTAVPAGQKKADPKLTQVADRLDRVIAKLEEAGVGAG